MSKVASIFDLECLARERLPGVVFDYIHGGSEQQLTVQRNLDDMRASRCASTACATCRTAT